MVIARYQVWIVLTVPWPCAFAAKVSDVASLSSAFSGSRVIDVSKTVLRLGEYLNSVQGTYLIHTVKMLAEYPEATAEPGADG